MFLMAKLNENSRFDARIAKDGIAKSGHSREHMGTGRVGQIQQKALQNRSFTGLKSGRGAEI